MPQQNVDRFIQVFAKCMSVKGSLDNGVLCIVYFNCILVQITIFLIFKILKKIGNGQFLLNMLIHSSNITNI